MSKIGMLMTAHKLAAGIIIGTVAVGGTAGGVVVHNHVQEVKAEKIEEQRVADLHDDAKAVDKLIEKIGTVTLDSESAINTADTAYNKLSKEGKSYVTKTDVLKKAKTDLNALKVQLAADQAAAKAVTDKITAIGNVTLDSEAAITDARTSLDALTDAQKPMVSNQDVLTAAETSLQGLKDAKAKADAEAAAAKKAAETKTVKSATNGTTVNKASAKTNANAGAQSTTNNTATSQGTAETPHVKDEYELGNEEYNRLYAQYGNPICTMAQRQIYWQDPSFHEETYPLPDYMTYRREQGTTVYTVGYLGNKPIYVDV
jgi:hypothetical protein